MRYPLKTIISLVLIALTLVNICLLPLLDGMQHPDYREPGIPVLTYHRVSEHSIKETYFSENKWVNDLDDFKANMKYLHDNGYQTLSMDEFYAWYRGEVDYNVNKTVVITFDDGDAENYYNVLPILKEYGFKATVFAIGNRTPERTPVFDGIRPTYLSHEQIAEMRRDYPNFEVQSHTYGFHSRYENGFLIDHADREALKKDFDAMREMGCEYYAYPYGAKGTVDAEAFEASGFKLGFGFGQPDLTYRRALRSDLPYYIARLKIDHVTEDMELFIELLK